MRLSDRLGSVLAIMASQDHQTSMLTGLATLASKTLTMANIELQPEAWVPGRQAVAKNLLA